MASLTCVERPTVSVLIAAYNTRAWIGGAIDSVLSQEGVTVEVIVIDDASTDGTAEFVEAHYHDSCVRLLQQAENRGPSAARNRGLYEARGEWIAVLDADDWFYPSRLRRLIEGADARGFDLVGDEQALYDDRATEPWALRLRRKGVFSGQNEPWHSLPIERVLQHTALGILQLAVRKDFLLEHGITWREDFRYGEDYLFLVECLLAGGRLGALDEPFYAVRIRHRSLTSDRWPAQRQLLKMFERVGQELEAHGRPELKAYVEAAMRRASRGMRYTKVMDKAKNRGFPAGLLVLLSHPEVWPMFLARMPKIVRYRMRRRRAGANR